MGTWSVGRSAPRLHELNLVPFYLLSQDTDAYNEFHKKIDKYQREVNRALVSNQNKPDFLTGCSWRDPPILSIRIGCQICGPTLILTLVR